MIIIWNISRVRARARVRVHIYINVYIHLFQIMHEHVFKLII